MIRCPSCGHQNDDAASFCEECAKALPELTESAPSPGAPPAAPAAGHPLIRCPTCSHANDETADFCENCATRLAVPAAAATPPSKRSPNLVLAWVAVGGAVLVLLLGGVAWWLTGDDGDPGPATTVATAPESTTAAPTSAASATTPSTGLADVADLPSGLFCRDLFARGYSYAQAVDYWNLEGQPDRMVAEDLPCQTVYPEGTVFAYWGLDDAGTPPGD